MSDDIVQPTPTPASPPTPAASEPIATPPVSEPMPTPQPEAGQPLAEAKPEVQKGPEINGAPATPTTVAAAAAHVVAGTPTESPVKSSMNMALLIPLALLAAGIAVGAIWFMGNNSVTTNSNAKTMVNPSASDSGKKAADATGSTSIEGMQKDVDAIDVKSNDDDFADVDKDLKSL